MMWRRSRVSRQETKEPRAARGSEPLREKGRVGDELKCVDAQHTGVSTSPMPLACRAAINRQIAASLFYD